MYLRFGRAGYGDGARSHMYTILRTSHRVPS
nr:MAG TPA: hypothetical protein [Caudoviricetes sp.]